MVEVTPMMKVPIGIDDSPKVMFFYDSVEV